jgi:hypothetical protein
MIYFALSLFLCINSTIGCQWLIVEHFTDEMECLDAGKQYTAEGGDIIDYKCIVKFRRDPRLNVG